MFNIFILMISSFFLELFLHWSPVAYWAPTNLGSSIFQRPIFLPFHTVHGVLKTRILKWFAIHFSTGPHFVRALHHQLYFSFTHHPSVCNINLQLISNNSILLMGTTSTCSNLIFLIPPSPYFHCCHSFHLYT